MISECIAKGLDRNRGNASAMPAAEIQQCDRRCHGLRESFFAVPEARPENWQKLRMSTSQEAIALSAANPLEEGGFQRPETLDSEVLHTGMSPTLLVLFAIPLGERFPEASHPQFQQLPSGAGNSPGI